MVLYTLKSILFLLIANSNSSALRCQRTETDVHGCCSDFRWDPTKGQCVVCSQGYTGMECSLTCPYPLFGEKCQQVCKCSEAECSFVNGCLNSKGEYSTAQYVSTSRNYNSSYQTMFHKKENNPTTQSNTHTSIELKKDVITIAENQIQTIWQVVIAILGILAILTTKYIGKCAYRLWKSRTSRLNVNTASSNTPIPSTNEVQSRVQRHTMYELAETGADDSFRAPYDEIRTSGILPNQILSQDKVYEEVMTDTPSSIPTECVLNMENIDIQEESDVREIDALYISPCM